MHEDNEDDLSYFYFFENWFLMAEGRDTDEKRLVFYDTIMRYAFDGVVPPRPKRGESPGKVWAAWDAYLLTKPVIDRVKAKIKACRTAGKAGKGTTRNKAVQIRNENETNTKRIRNENETKAIINKKEKRIKKEEDIEEESRHQQHHTVDDIKGLTTPPVLPSEAEMKLYAKQKSVPEEYLPVFLKEIEAMGWQYIDRNGNTIILNRINFKSVLGKFWATTCRRSKGNGSERGGRNVYVESGEKFGLF